MTDECRPPEGLDPIIAALIEKLPRGKSAPFSADERLLWLRTMAMAFHLAYGGPVVETLATPPEGGKDEG